MANAVFAHHNLADAAAATVSVSSSQTMTPPRRLTAEFPQLVKICRNRGESTWSVLVDLGSVQSFSVMALFGVNLTLAGTARFRVSSADPTGQAGEIHNSNGGVPLAGLVDPKYGYLIRYLSSPVSGRYALFDMAEIGLPFIQGGRVWVSPSQQVTVNIQPGFSRDRKDASVHTENEDGVEYTDRRARHRVWDARFDFLTQAEADGFVEDMSWRNAETDDVLLIKNPASSNLGYDSILGRAKREPVVQPYTTSNEFSTRYIFRERQ